MTQTTRNVSENDQFRADIYQLLAALLRRSPSAELLQFLHSLELEESQGDDQDNDMSRAWAAIKLAAGQYTPEQLEDEYFTVFLGVGSGEVLPYGSWFITGTLMDKPLALLRQDLAQMGFEREDDVKEPEDHVAALCEVMSVLILEAPGYRQLAFYQRHMASWIDTFCDTVAKAPSAAFYTSVAQLAKAFFATEAREFEQLSLDIPVNCPGSSDITPASEETEVIH